MMLVHTCVHDYFLSVLFSGGFGHPYYVVSSQKPLPKEYTVIDGCEIPDWEAPYQVFHILENNNLVIIEVFSKE